MDVLRDTAAAQFAIHPERIREWLEPKIGPGGTRREEGVEYEARWLKRLGEKVKIEGLEASRLYQVCRTFEPEGIPSAPSR